MNHVCSPHILHFQFSLFGAFNYNIWPKYVINGKNTANLCHLGINFSIARDGHSEAIYHLYLC